MRRITPTLVVCVVAATATAVALARPGLPAAEDPDQPSPYASSLPPAAGGGRLVIADFAFGPVTTSAGSTVTVVNEDDATHTVTSSDGAFDTGRIAGLGEAELTAPAEPGEYRFFCAIHPSMAGILVVED
jgi:hypothetical protein